MQRMSDDENGEDIEEIGVAVENPEKSIVFEHDESMSDIEIN